jgi:clan AA aspartic protease
MGCVHVDITLTNLFLKKSFQVHALVDTGAFLMVIPPSMATGLGFDLEEMSARMVTLADGSQTLRPCVPLEVKWQDRTTSCDAMVLGDQCMVGVLALEGMGLVVDPVQQRVIPNPKHPNGPILFAAMSAMLDLLSKREPPAA